jgi:transcriptional regulator with XRE-family HTH domain
MSEIEILKQHKERKEKKEKKRKAKNCDHNIGKNIRYLRDKFKISARKLAVLSDISGTSLSNIEKKNINPSLLTAYKISQALGVPLETLINGLRKEAKFVNVTYLFFEDFVKNEISVYKELTPSETLIIYEEYKDDIWNVLHAKAADKNIDNTWEFISNLISKRTDYWMHFNHQMTLCAIKIVLDELTEVSDE